MIRTKKIFNLIKICEIYYESRDVVIDALKSDHHSVRIFSYEKLDLPKEYLLRRVKKTTRIVLKDKTKEDIFPMFKKNYRNEINKTYKDDCYRVEIVEGFSDKGYSLYSEFENYSKRRPIKRKEGKGVWALGYIDGELVSGIFFINALPVLKVISIFSLRKRKEIEYQKKVGYVSKRLILEACYFGKEKKIDFVDLAYINQIDPSKAGITAYKLGFGGDVVDEYIYERDTRKINFFKWLRKKIDV
ncbi:MAG: hypothetical protein KBC35_02020 [Candidatus Pacebacteria bacterium]|nr:hypothetical protein [Candidatus Paceibacterota bacterium]